MKRFLLPLLLIATIVAIGFGGWKYWQNRDAEQTKTTPNNSQKANDPSEGGKYMVIEEWGVKFLLPEDLRGDTAYIKDPFHDDAFKFYSLSMESLSLSCGKNAQSINN